MPVRLATAALFLAAVFIAMLTPVPNELPAVALGQVAVYRVEVLLALVYGGLLLLTPLLRGVMHGQLPVEISHKGTKWPEEETDEAVESLRRKVDRIEGERDMLLKSKHSNP